jgi:hypothetical protein
MNLSGTFAKRFQMIKHAFHFRRTLPVLLVSEAMVAPVWCGVTGIHRLCQHQRQHRENLSYDQRPRLDCVNQMRLAQTKNARAFGPRVSD